VVRHLFLTQSDGADDQRLCSRNLGQRRKAEYAPRHLGVIWPIGTWVPPSDRYGRQADV